MCNLGFVRLKVKTSDRDKSAKGNKSKCANVKVAVTLREEIGQPERRGRKKAVEKRGHFLCEKEVNQS